MLIMLYNQFMKKEIKDKFVEAGSLFACIAILLAIGYFTGFIKGFTASDFQDAYNKTIYDLTKSAAGKGKTNLLSTNSSRGKRVSSYKGYHPMLIPQAVLRGVAASGAWKQIFYSDKKVVFYVYNNMQSDFHYSVQNYLSTKTKINRYNLYAYTENEFNGMRVGDIGPSKICDSLQECNAVRQKAADYSSLAEFLKYCGKTMCIINPSNGQYIRLKSKNSGQAVKIINDMVNW